MNSVHNATIPNVELKMKGQNTVNMAALHILTSIVVPIIFSIIILVGILGNGLVICVIIINRNLRVSSTNILIAALAIADLTFVLFCVPLTLSIYLTMGWAWGQTLCQFYQYLSQLTAYWSVYTLVLMTVDRYLAVVHPISSIILRTNQNALWTVMLVWALLMLTNLPMFINSGIAYKSYYSSNATQHKTFYCTYKQIVQYNATSDNYNEDFRAMGNFYLLFFLFAFLFPLLVIIVLYSFLLSRINRRSRKHQSTSIQRTNRKITRLIVIVIIVFAGCWLPIHTVFFIQSNMGDPTAIGFRLYHILANALSYANSMINPILYAFLSENFRSAFTNFLCCTTLHNAAASNHNQAILTQTYSSNHRSKLINKMSTDEATSQEAIRLSACKVIENVASLE